MDFTNKELMLIQAALTDSLIVLNMEKEELDKPAALIITALKNHEEETWALIKKISFHLGGI